MEPITVNLPRYVSKIVKEYAAGTIAAKDVMLDVVGGHITKGTYTFTLPTYDVFGDRIGTRDIALTVEKLVATKTMVLAELEKHVAQVDEFVKQYDLLIAVLQDVKNKKK
jgi:hypothetical protein